MCCCGSLNLTKKFLRKYKGLRSIEVYKLVEKNRRNNTLNGLYYGTGYKQGLIESTSERDSPIECNTAIYHGIHVLLSLKSAKKHLELNMIHNQGSDIKVVKMTAKISDLICVGTFDGGMENDNAVFRSVFFTKKEYDKALGIKRKR